MKINGHEKTIIALEEALEKAIRAYEIIGGDSQKQAIFSYQKQIEALKHFAQRPRRYNPRNYI